MSARGRGPVLVPAFALLAAAALAPVAARAQALPFEAIPFGGLVVPMGRLVDQGSATLSHETAVTFGGRLDAWLTRSAALELAFSYSLSGYHATTTGGQTVDTTGGLLAVTGRFAYRFARTGPVLWQGVAGAGVMLHTGAYLGNMAPSGRQHLTGVVGLSGRIPVSEGTALMVSAEDYFCSVKLSGISGITPAAHFNNYPVLSLGVVVPLGARGEDDDEYRVIR